MWSGLESDDYKDKQNKYTIALLIMNHTTLTNINPNRVIEINKKILNTFHEIIVDMGKTY